jgi:hypothetical protein
MLFVWQIKLDILAFVDITVSTVSSILKAQNTLTKGLQYDLKHKSIIIFNWL